MQYSPDSTKAILDGRKTRTTRPQTLDGHCERLPCRYKVGRTYAVCPGRQKKAVARILVTKVRDAGSAWQAPLLEGLGNEDQYGIAEGFEDVEGFWRRWRELYATNRTKCHGPVHVIDFELVKELVE